MKPNQGENKENNDDSAPRTVEASNYNYSDKNIDD